MEGQNYGESPTRNLNKSFSVIKNLRILPVMGYEDSAHKENIEIESNLLPIIETTAEKKQKKPGKIEENPSRNLYFEIESINFIPKIV